MEIPIVLSCRKTAEKIARGDFEEGGWAFKFLIRLHLLYCRHCRRFLRQMRIIAQAARLKSERLLNASQIESFENRLIARLKS